MLHKRERGRVARLGGWGTGWGGGGWGRVASFGSVYREGKRTWVNRWGGWGRGEVLQRGEGGKGVQMVTG